MARGIANVLTVGIVRGAMLFAVISVAHFRGLTMMLGDALKQCSGIQLWVQQDPSCVIMKFDDMFLTGWT